MWGHDSTTRKVMTFITTTVTKPNTKDETPLATTAGGVEGHNKGFFFFFALNITKCLF